MNDQPPQLDNQISKPDKVKALADYIVAECKKQGFTVRDFEWLYLEMSTILENRTNETYNELF